MNIRPPSGSTPVAGPPLPGQLVLDTCVLVSSVLRPLLLDLARQAVYAPIWSATIGDEWRRTTTHLWQLAPEEIADQWRAMQQAFPQADMGDVSAFKQGLQFSDPKDWHVIAAARSAQAQQPGLGVAVLTRNIRDFHRAELRRLGIQLLDPDQYLTRLWQAQPLAMQAVLTHLPDRARVAGRPLESLDALLHRERLFRLRRATGG
ncbi:MAG TPA: PIN domain-containing protein [Burkholderiaceae bacterium]|nr:PIN domain-containing protein [Burkholderiaceae bacterium]